MLKSIFGNSNSNNKKPTYSSCKNGEKISDIRFTDNTVSLNYDSTQNKDAIATSQTLDGGVQNPSFIHHLYNQYNHYRIKRHHLNLVLVSRNWYKFMKNHYLPKLIHNVIDDQFIENDLSPRRKFFFFRTPHTVSLNSNYINSHNRQLVEYQNHLINNIDTPTETTTTTTSTTPSTNNNNNDISQQFYQISNSARKLYFKLEAKLPEWDLCLWFKIVKKIKLDYQTNSILDSLVILSKQYQLSNIRFSRIKGVSSPPSKFIELFAGESTEIEEKDKQKETEKEKNDVDAMKIGSFRERMVALTRNIKNQTVTGSHLNGKVNYKKFFMNVGRLKKFSIRLPHTEDMMKQMGFEPIYLKYLTDDTQLKLVLDFWQSYKHPTLTQDLKNLKISKLEVPIVTQEILDLIIDHPEITKFSIEHNNTVEINVGGIFKNTQAIKNQFKRLVLNYDPLQSSDFECPTKLKSIEFITNAHIYVNPKLCQFLYKLEVANPPLQELVLPTSLYFDDLLVRQLSSLLASHSCSNLRRFTFGINGFKGDDKKDPIGFIAIIEAIEKSYRDHKRDIYLNLYIKTKLQVDRIQQFLNRIVTSESLNHILFQSINNEDIDVNPFLHEVINEKPFRLAKNFVDKYRNKRAPFGFGVLGELVYLRTYSRIKPETGTNEQWYETVERVVNGTYNMQKQWIEKHGLGWNPAKAQSSAQNMFERIFQMKFLPPGRGLWAMGSPLTETRGLYAALNNCAFVSTEHIKKSPSKPFIFLMDASMLGVGVGFDTKGAGSLVIKGPKLDKPSQSYTIPDSREGWVESVRLILDSYLLPNKPKQEFDYSLIRKFGEPIKGFGGFSSGPESLELLHNSIRETLDKEIGKPISVTSIVDLMNHIGKCVVSGNTRQTAEIAFGDPSSEEYIDLKNYKVNPHRESFGWTSNNSVFANLGMDYHNICQRIVQNGEPGFAWLDNMQKFSRMIDGEDHKDIRAQGGNPCLEQTLESYELCLEDFLETLKYAFLYAKTVTLGKTQWPDTNRVLLRNRRIGCSMSGIAQFITHRGLDQLKKWSTEGYLAIQNYDRNFSEWLAIPQSIKTTSIKPSGTVSLLAGATPGMHYPISEYYIRRVRLQKSSSLLPPMIDAGYKVEPAEDNKSNMVVEIPIHSGKGIRKANSITMWEQLSLAAFLQKYWADNQVSCTVSFDIDREGPQLKHALEYFQYQLKGVSFLPMSSDSSATVYKQMPYEEIDESTYLNMSKPLNPVNFNKHITPSEPAPDKFCDSTSCSVISNEPENLGGV
eukprot:gene780-968_t